MTELDAKLARVRSALQRHELAAVRFRGTDWFSWATCGGSNAVLLTTDVGVAEVLVTGDGAWVMTDVIEAGRLAAEEIPTGLPVHATPWERPAEREAFVHERASGGAIASDRPVDGERPLPRSLVRAPLLEVELERYRCLGRDAAEAMTELLTAARPDWTGLRVAGVASELLWFRGIHPALVLVGDARRVRAHRHPTAADVPLGDRAMVVFCARRRGLFANLTRWVSFRAETVAERALGADVAAVEAAALTASRPAAALADVLGTITAAYAARGHAGAERLHHQGGSCGYLSRDAVARPGVPTRLADRDAVAWNPSLPGAKIEDTFAVDAAGVEVLTVDPRWPTFDVNGRPRPAVLVR